MAGHLCLGHVRDNHRPHRPAWSPRHPPFSLQRMVGLPRVSRLIGLPAWRPRVERQAVPGEEQQGVFQPCRLVSERLRVRARIRLSVPQQVELLPLRRWSAAALRGAHPCLRGGPPASIAPLPGRKPRRRMFPALQVPCYQVPASLVCVPSGAVYSARDFPWYQVGFDTGINGFRRPQPLQPLQPASHRRRRLRARIPRS